MIAMIGRRDDLTVYCTRRLMSTHYTGVRFPRGSNYIATISSHARVSFSSREIIISQRNERLQAAVLYTCSGAHYVHTQRFQCFRSFTNTQESFGCLAGHSTMKKPH